MTAKEAYNMTVSIYQLADKEVNILYDEIKKICLMGMYSYYNTRYIRPDVLERVKDILIKNGYGYIKDESENASHYNFTIRWNNNHENSN